MNARWVRYLPVVFGKHLQDKTSLQAAIGNTGWLIADNMIRMILGLLIGAWVARYLAPALFGELVYVTAFVAFFQAACRLGLDAVVIRELARNSETAFRVLGTVLRLRMVAGMVCWILAVTGMFLLRPDDSEALLMVAIVAASVTFQASDTIDLWFQSCTRSKRTVVAKVASVIIASSLRVLLILLSAPVEAFAVVILIESALTAMLLVFSYRRYTTTLAWQWCRHQARQLLRESWPYLVATIATLFYMRVDQLMLREMVGSVELGIYSAALPLSGTWYFVPGAICASVAPVLARKKSRSEQEYTTALSRLFSIMWWYSLPLSAAISLLSIPLVELLYGSAYSASAAVLAVHVFANVPVALGLAQSQWVANDRRSHFILVVTLAGAFTNIGLNLLLIPGNGALGAAWATVAAQLVAAMGLNVILAPQIFKMQLRALVRYV